MAGIFLTLALVAALIHLVMIARSQEATPAAPWVKTASVAFLAAESWVLGTPAFVTAALALGAVGDHALTRRGARDFLIGMAAFAAGHLAYAGGFFLRGQELAALGLTDRAGWPVLVPLVLFLASTELWLAPHTGALRGPVRGYVLVIGLMTAVALTLPDHGGRGMILAGAGLFLASDLLLALRLFRAETAGQAWWLSVTLWPAYWAGQLLLLLGGLIYGRLAP